jgi:hypothetical protein
MKKTWLVLAVLMAGCGNDSGTTPDLGAGEGGDLAAPTGGDLAATVHDMTPPRDLFYIPSTDGGPFKCGSQVCGAGTMCCIGASGASCETSCGDAGLPVQCSGPEFCGGNPCCVTLENRVPKGVFCTSAQTDCVPGFDSMFMNGMTRACHGDIDCTAGAAGTQAGSCCTASLGGMSQQICFNKTLASFTQGAINCP